jgi:predicted amidohydrolase
LAICCALWHDSAADVNADGSHLGKYRKMHIPQVVPRPLASDKRICIPCGDTESVVEGTSSF